MTQVQSPQTSQSAGGPESEITSFCIEQQVIFDAPREQVWRALTADIDQWWSKRLHHSQGPSTVTLDARIGGDVIESWDDDTGVGAVRWGTINHLAGPELIRLSGTMGMVDAPVNNVWTFALEELGDRTSLKLTHRALGLIKPEWRDGYSAGWSELLNVCLKKYLDDGANWKDALAETKEP